MTLLFDLNSGGFKVLLLGIFACLLLLAVLAFVVLLKTYKNKKLAKGFLVNSGLWLLSYLIGREIFNVLYVMSPITIILVAHLILLIREKGKEHF